MQQAGMPHGPGVYEEIEAKLLDTRTEWARRLEVIQADRRRQRDPLDPDFDDVAGSDREYRPPIEPFLEDSARW